MRLGPDGPRCYLSAAIDLFDGRVAAWSAGPSPSKALVQGMLSQLEGELEPGCVIHSDRGWHYRTPDWVSACEAMGVTRSMSRLGHSPDNAACEAFSGRLKVEMFEERDWSGWSAGEFVAELGRYIDWHDGERLKSFDEGARGVGHDRRQEEAPWPRGLSCVVSKKKSVSPTLIRTLSHS